MESIAGFPDRSEENRPIRQNRRRKLLFLAHRFPPTQTSACVRTWNVAKHLSESGWDVTVVTPDPALWRHTDNPGNVDALCSRLGIRRIFTGHRWRHLAPDHFQCWNQGFGWFAGGVCRKIARGLAIDNGIGWLDEAEKACSALTPNDVDVILASGAPFTAFKLAKRLSSRFARPYVLDYRDPWTENPHRPRPARPATVREETRLLADAAAVTIVSRSWGLAMDRRFRLGEKLHIIPNGYDPEELENVEPNHFGHFAIVYTGNFYPPKRVISPVMAALQQVKRTSNGSGINWYFHYYGSQAAHVREEAERFGLTDKVVLHGFVRRAEALSAVKGASVAVVITTVEGETGHKEQGIVPGKIFETLGLGAPMLLIAPPASDARSILESTGLASAHAGSDVSGMARSLQEMMERRRVRNKHIEVCSWANIAKRLDSILKMVLDGAETPGL